MPNQERQTSSELQVHDRQDSADTTRDQISEQDTNLAGERLKDRIIVAPNNENPIGVMKSPSESQGSLKVENIEIDRLHPNPRQPRKRQRADLPNSGVFVSYPCVDDWSYPCFHHFAHIDATGHPVKIQVRNR